MREVQYLYIEQDAVHWNLTSDGDLHVFALVAMSHCVILVDATHFEARVKGFCNVKLNKDKSNELPKYIFPGSSASQHVQLFHGSPQLLFLDCCKLRCIRR